MRLAKSKLLSGHAGLLIIIIVAIVVLFGAVGARVWYTHNLGPVSSVTTTQHFTISSGTSVHQIAIDLQKSGLIRSTGAFETYVRGRGYSDNLQAGTYLLSPSMSVAQIVDKLVNGDVTKDLVTILPAKRIDQIKQGFIKAGYSSREVETAFNPELYKGHSALASLPKGASLEGYLYPDSFQKQADTSAQTIVRESLDEMSKHLTSHILKGFKARGLNTYQGITLASIVAQESDDPTSQPKIAQVFLSRLERDMALESNVTAYYAADIAGAVRNVNIASPYNTYLHKGLPPGPISNVTASALGAVAYPAKTKYLYFITGDNGKMYFSYTQEEHQALVDKYCKKSCAQ